MERRVDPGRILARRHVHRRQYAEYLASINQPQPESWAEAGIPAQMGDHPVEGIDFNSAETYCQWANKRLPSEAEWEAAARGPYAWLYPWGNQNSSVPLPQSGTYPVGSLPANRSFFGAFDMAGNVWEWVSQPDQPVAPGEQVLRGGANSFQNDLTARVVGDPDNPIMFTNAGFRCASSNVQPEPDPQLLAQDNFAHIDSGWYQAKAPIGPYFFGYHPPDNYHVQLSEPEACVTVYRDSLYKDFMAEVRVYTAATADEEGQYSTG
jgi:hypothetical protein